MGVKIKEAALFQIKDIQSDVVDVLDKYADKAMKDFDLITGTWSHDVDVSKTVVDRGKTAYSEVVTDDEIMFYLDEGTGVRYATMTPDFKPKTKVGQLKSGPGRGGVAFVSKQHVHKGIDARKFMETIIAKHGDDFVKDMNEAAKKVNDRRQD